MNSEPKTKESVIIKPIDEVKKEESVQEKDLEAVPEYKPSRADSPNYNHPWPGGTE